MDTSEAPWQEKLERYHELGIKELVRFDAEAPRGARLRIWDRVDGNLLERDVEDDRSPSDVLDVWWVVVEDEALGCALRPSRDPAGTDLLPTPVEQERRAREVAERRVAELEAKLEGHRG